MKIGDKALVKLDDNGYVRWFEGVVESVSEKDGIETSVISADFFNESNQALYYGDNSGGNLGAGSHHNPPRGA